MKKLYLIMMLLSVTSVLAATPNPGHDASRIGSGAFSAGDFTFNGTLRVMNTTNSTLFTIDSTTGIITINGSIRTTGGNARGTNATDLQTSRTENVQVASGNYSVIAGGHGNNASGTYSVVTGGAFNTANDTYAAVVGGTSNRAYNIYSFVGGGNGNRATGNSAAVVGGQSNHANATWSFIGGGSTNLADGQQAVVVGGNTNKNHGVAGFIGAGTANFIVAGTQNAVVVGGVSNNATAWYSAILGGESNNATGTYSVVLGGSASRARGDYAITAGEGLTAQAYGQLAIGRWNTIQGTGTSSWVAGDQAFVIGNGSNASARNTAFYVTNNGTVWTGGAVVTPKLCLNGDCQTSWPSIVGISSAGGWTNTSATTTTGLNVSMTGTLSVTGNTTLNAGGAGYVLVAQAATPTVSGAVAGDVILYNNRYLRGANAANNAALRLIGTTTNDEVAVGDASGTTRFTGNHKLILGDSVSTNMSAVNLLLSNGVAPAGNPSDGVFLWASSGGLNVKGSGGTTVTINSSGSILNVPSMIVGGADNGAVIFYRNSNPASIGNTDAVLYVSDRSGSDWGVVADKAGFDYGFRADVDNAAGYAFAVYNGSTYMARITGGGQGVFTTVDTGNGGNELYAMDQNVRTSDSPSFVRLTSTQATGTAPFTVSSTTVVTNLNADKVDGQDYSSTWPTTLANIQSATTNDFHNIGGTDDDTPDNDAEVPDAITVSGGTLGSNTISSGATFSTAGTWTLGDNGDAVVISASNWDVDSSGNMNVNILSSGAGTTGFVNSKSFLWGTDGTETNYRWQSYLSGNDLMLYSRGLGHVMAFNYTTGYVGIGSSAPTQSLEVSGAGLFMGSSISGNTKNGVYIWDSSIASLAGGNSRNLTIGGENLMFQTGVTYAEKMRLDSSGNLGVGTAASGYKLEVNGSIKIHGDIDFNIGAPGRTIAVSRIARQNSVADLTLDAQGDHLKITSLESGTTGTYMCYNSGTVTQGASCSASSIRFKHNVEDLGHGLADVARLRPITYQYNPELGWGEDVRMGFIAEEIQPIIPEAVNLNKDGLAESINYDQLTAVLAKSIQELNAKDNEIEARNREFEQRLIALEQPGTSENAFGRIRSQDNDVVITLGGGGQQ